MNDLTPQQQAAIAARGNVLVAAGAGTGKTSTLTARCLELVVQEGCPLDRILVVTFTDAAAAEMRARIRQALQEARMEAESSSNPDLAARLTEELALLDIAPISTLHSFCLDLVRRNFQTLGLDPQFTVLDEQQTEPLIRAVLDELFQRHYAGDTTVSAAVRDLVRLYGSGRDESIRKLVVKLHRHTQALAAPEKWFEQQIAAFRDESPTAWRETFVAGVAEWVWLWRDALAASAETNSNLAACRSALAALPDSGSTFAQAAEVVQRIVAADGGEWERGTKTKIRKPFEAFFNEAAFLAELTCDDGAPLAEDWSWSRGPMLTLLQLAREFAAEFTRAKRELGGVDFADQEQLALRLLYDDRERLTHVARACRERFRYVFVDEYQDINAAQDAVLRAVSREGAEANRFLVGDVKQSIYRFRLADPSIFQDYHERWSDTCSGRAGRPLPAARVTEDGTHGVSRPTVPGHTLSLTENFRSREALLRFINPLFRAVMRPVIGGLNYQADRELQFGNPAERHDLSVAAKLPPHEVSPRVEWHLIAKTSDTEIADDAPNEEEKSRELLDLLTTEREARLVAGRLKELKQSGHRIWQREPRCFAPVDYRDMVVLLRGVAGRAEIFAKAFHRAGVPLLAERAGFLQALEVTDLLNLLRLLDNPLQDVPLLAVLRSPLVGLSAEELVQVRLAQRHGLLWFALRKLGESGSNDLPPSSSRFAGRGEGNSVEPRPASTLPIKASWFLQRWASWRALTRHTSLSHCLETALTETHYEALLLAGERGPVRVANVRRLVDMARRFDPYQREGLFRFLQFVAGQEEAGVRHEPAVLNAENAVRLMTIHAGKGLEFPVVVLAGLGIGFNLRDLRDDILLNEELGLCPKVLPPGGRRCYPSIAHWVATQRERRALLGEEMRLLYVALTRARDTLILTGTATRKDEVERWKNATPVTDYTLVKAKSYADWLRLWFAQATKPGEWSGENEGGNARLRWKFHDPRDAKFASGSGAEAQAACVLKPPTAAELARLKSLLALRYPHAAATREPAKTSVSLLRRGLVEADEEAQPIFQAPWRTRALAPPRAGGEKLSAAEIGTAHHTFLQLVSLERVGSERELKHEAAQMQQAGALSAEEVAALDWTALADFWQSELGRRICQKSRNVQREMPFTARFATAELDSVAGSARCADSQRGVPTSEFVVVQGVVDLAVLLPKEIWLVDFKTDAVKAAEVDAQAKLYEPQLKLYALALSRIYQRPVTECRLHFLGLQRSVSVSAL